MFSIERSITVLLQEYHVYDETEFRAFFLSPLLPFLFIICLYFLEGERKRGKGRLMATDKCTEFRFIHVYQYTTIHDVPKKKLYFNIWPYNFPTNVFTFHKCYLQAGDFSFFQCTYSIFRSIQIYDFFYTLYMFYRNVLKNVKVQFKRHWNT